MAGCSYDCCSASQSMPSPDPSFSLVLVLHVLLLGTLSPKLSEIFATCAEEAQLHFRLPSAWGDTAAVNTVISLGFLRATPEG